MTEYQAQKPLHDEVILRATIAYLPGASLSDVRDFGAYSSNMHIYDINAQYVIVLRGSGLTYIDVQQRLQDAFDSGAFDLTLHDTAVQYGAPGLSNASCTEMFTTDLEGLYSDDDDDAELLTMSAIVGIAVGGAVLLCILISACVWWYRSTPPITNAAIGAQQKSASSVSADDPNLHVYGRVAAADPALGKLEQEGVELVPSAPPVGAVAVGVRYDAQSTYYPGMAVTALPTAEVVPYTQQYESV